MHFKKLVGKRCYLSPIDTADAPLYTEWLNDLEVSTNLILYTKQITLANEIEAITQLSKEHAYGIVDLETDKLIGNTSLHNIDYTNKRAECGIFIGDKNFWNKGYGREALSLLIDFGFQYLNLKNIMLFYYEFNQKGRRCYDAVGFKQIGIRRKALIQRMQEFDIIYMDILPSDFYKNTI